MKQIACVLLIICCNSFTSFSQSENMWKAIKDETGIVKTKSVLRMSFPKNYQLFKLDIAAFKRIAFEVVENSIRHTTVISLPNANGELEEFEIVEASNFEPALQARYPEIRAFSGRGITDKYATLKLSYSPEGIQTMVVRIGSEREYIEPFSSDHSVYALFTPKRNLPIPWLCSTADEPMANSLNTQVAALNLTARSGGDLKTLRLAQSVTAEYSNYFGATSASQSALVLAAVNNTLTRCNGVYEMDLALHLNLVANTTDVFYYNPATDPYDNASTGAGGTWNAQLQQTLTSVIGEANYDIGHLFGASGGGGNAGCIGCVCTNGSKGSGYTSPADGIPSGDNFDIDYVVHEIGHQLGANHTFSHNLEGTGVNKEPGSGITIMGYAGITSYDMANHSIAFYHQASIAQIQANLLTKTCAVTTNITANNATPVVATVGNYTIPISTPFALTGSATDANADPLTYSWEQNDNSTVSGANSIASISKASGPNWITFPPTTSPTRLFPRLATILSGANVTGPLTGGDAGANSEALSSVARTLNFRLTVRDNAPYSSTAPVKVGQTQFTDMIVTVSAAAGPFSVTQPNTNVSWAAGSSQVINWNVASTTASPVSCANVKISMSVDGGQTFPYVLSASTPNDGTETLSLPIVTANTTARIKVEAVGNIFFDISNTNFTITEPTGPTFDFSTPPSTNISCGNTTSASTNLTTTATLGYTTPINLTASGAPAGTTVTFGTNPVTPGNTTTVTLNNVNSLATGTYIITVTGISGSITKNVDVTFVVQTGTTPSISTNPSSQTVCNGGSATFSPVITGTATGYQWQLSTDNGVTFTAISDAVSLSYSINNIALTQNGNRYRVIVTGQCNTATSNAATLTVIPTPNAPVISPAVATICNGQIQALSTSAQTNITFSFGTQAATNSASTNSAGYPAPYSAYYGGQRMQMLIRASELTAAGFSTGSQLNNIQFPVVSRGANWGGSITSLNNFKVSIGTTTLTTLTSFQTGLQEVTAASNFTPAVGYNNTHTFASGYTWDGTSNLIVETTFSNNITGTAGTLVTQYNSPAGFQSTIVYRADGVTAAAAATATSVSFSYSSRPDFKINGVAIAPITWTPATNLFSDAGATTAYTGTSTNSVFAKPTETTSYIAIAGSGCTSRDTIVITVNPLPVINNNPSASRCGSGTVTLNATTTAGSTVDWYTASTGGTAFLTNNNSFTTPAISTTTVYYAEAKNTSTGCIAGARTIVTATINAVPATPTISAGGSTSFCTGGNVTLSSSSATNNSWSNGATSQSIIVNSSGNFSVTVTNAAACSATSAVTTVTANPCGVTLNLTLFLEGYYRGAGEMNPLLYNIGISNNPNETDSIVVNLWLPTNVSAASPNYSFKTVLYKNGTASIPLTGVPSGSSYYLAIKHRNHIETWSALPVTMNTITNYNFSNAVSKAFGDGVIAPMKNLGGGIFSFYSGDVNQDGTVDGLDMNSIDVDANNFAFGYNNSDCNGDGATDGLDMNYVDNNASLLIFYARP